MSTIEFATLIKAEATRLGFALAGLTTPEPPAHFERYEAWLAAGRHGEMGYLATERARQRRADPRLILPECRSILVLAAAYPANSPLKEKGVRISMVEPGSTIEIQESVLLADWRGQVASYAWGADYHDVLPQAMQSLVEFIQAQVDRPLTYRCYTDSAPLLERELAQRAGLGWIGKNSCLINPQIGSYFFLAEILLELELPPDQPFTPDRCGTCTRCIDACPTGCILPDRTLDARRCISYLTIELKGAIPEELRPAIGDWIFGCDICQQVCPWNRPRDGAAPLPGDRPGIFPRLEPRPDQAEPGLNSELALAAEAFNRKFKGSPVLRAKRRGYLRNVAVALGNRLRRQGGAVPAAAAAIAALEQARDAEVEPLVREHVEWALGEES
jgi:epoxyqueuosine reductase